MTDPTTPAEHPWRRYVAIGDSFTEGMVDVDPRHEGRFIGWADRLAAELAGRTGGEELHYANLAIRSKFLDQVVTDQLDLAIAMRPTHISFAAGGNDLLSLRADVDGIATRYEAALRRLVDTGAAYVIPDPPADLGRTGPLLDMQSGYLARAADLMPRSTATYPWAMKQNFFADAWSTNRADLDDGLRWAAAARPVAAASDGSSK